MTKTIREVLEDTQYYSPFGEEWWRNSYLQEIIDNITDPCIAWNIIVKTIRERI